MTEQLLHGFGLYGGTVLVCFIAGLVPLVNAEVFLVESGTATFQIGSETIEVTGGHVVVSPPGEAHGFTNTGDGELRLTAIHGAERFTTEWLAGADPVWTSEPGARS